MQINCDGVVYNPLGGASYVFENGIIPYILETLHKNKLKKVLVHNQILHHILEHWKQ